MSRGQLGSSVPSAYAALSSRRPVVVAVVVGVLVLTTLVTHGLMRPDQGAARRGDESADSITRTAPSPDQAAGYLESAEALSRTPVRVEGVVLAAENDQPLADARVEVCDPAEFWSGFTVSPTALDRPALERLPLSARAEFELPASWDSPEVLFQASAEGFATHRVKVTGSTESGDVQRLTIRLAPAGSLSGRVLDPDGRAAAGVEVHAIRYDALDATRYPDVRRALREAIWGTGAERRDGYANRAFTHTEADGTFRLPGLVADAEYAVISLWNERTCASDVVRSRVRSDAVGRIALNLRSARFFDVQVVDSDGQPASVTDVVITPDCGGQSGFPFGNQILFSLMIGTHRVELSTERHWPVRQELLVPPDGSAQQTTIRLPAGNLLSGSVASFAGAPVAYAVVEIDAVSSGPLHGRRFTTTTADDGTFFVRGAPPGALILRARTEDGWTSPPVRIDSARHGAHIVVLQAPAVILGAAGGGSGPGSDARYASRVRGASTWRTAAVSRKRGHPYLLPIQDGAEVELEVVADGFLLLRTVLDRGAADADGFFRTNLRAAPRLACRALRASGEPLADHKVVVRHLGDSATLLHYYTDTRTAADGTFSVSLPTDDALEITVLGPGASQVVRRIATPGDVSDPLEFRLPE